MNTLIIYDETGAVIFSQTGRNIPSLVGTAVMEVPAGKEVDRVNPETGEVILKDREKTAGEQLETLKKAASITAAGFTDEQAAKVPDLYPAWEPAEAVQPGDRRSWAESSIRPCRPTPPRPTGRPTPCPPCGQR